MLKTLTMKKFTIIIILLFSNAIHAHKDIWREFKYGNVQAGIVTGYEDYEEINKVKIINQLAFELSKKLNYDKPILMYFKHCYVDSINKPEYFIGHGTWQLNEVKKKKKGLHIWFYAKEYDVLQCLKIIEYAIIHANEIPLLQKQVVYKGEYREETHTALDEKFTINALLREESDILKEISKMKIYALDDKISTGFTYYWQDYKFHIEYIDTNQKTTLLTLDNIRYFEYVWGDVLVFDTQNTFYYLDRRSGSVSSRQFIENHYNKHRPYNIEALGDSTYAILTERPSFYNQRIIYYSFKDNLLLQDLNKFIKEKK